MSASLSDAPSRRVEVYRLGLVGYERGLEWQEEHSDRLRTGGPEVLALLEHPPVYTLGARGDLSHLLADISTLEARGARAGAIYRIASSTWPPPP